MQSPGSGDVTHYSDSYIYSTFMFFVPMCFLYNLRGEGNEWESGLNTAGLTLRCRPA